MEMDRAMSEKMKNVNEAFLANVATTLNEKPDVVLIPIFDSYIRHVRKIIPNVDDEGFTKVILSGIPNGNGYGDSDSPSPVNGVPETVRMDLKRGHTDSPNSQESKQKKLMTDSPTKSFFAATSKDPPVPAVQAPVKPLFEFKKETKIEDMKPLLSTFSFFNKTAVPINSTAAAVGNHEPKQDKDNEEEESDEPPKNEFKQITEDNSIYQVRCKVYKKGPEGQPKDHGIGQLYVKKLENGKYQIVVRAENTLGTPLLNTLLSKSLPLNAKGKDVTTYEPNKEQGKPPVTVFIRVKTPEAASELFNKLKECQTQSA